MGIKKLVFFISSLMGPRGLRRIKNSSSNEAAMSGAEDRVVEAESESLGGSEGMAEAELCCVCLSRLKEGEDTRLLPCLHEFHRVCVDRWFGVCRKTCPVCRFSMEDDDKSQKREELTEEMVIWFSSFHVAGF